MQSATSSRRCSTTSSRRCSSTTSSRRCSTTSSSRGSTAAPPAVGDAPPAVGDAAAPPAVGDAAPPAVGDAAAPPAVGDAAAPPAVGDAAAVSPVTTTTSSLLNDTDKNDETKPEGDSKDTDVIEPDSQVDLDVEPTEAPALTTTPKVQLSQTKEPCKFDPCHTIWLANLLNLTTAPGLLQQAICEQILLDSPPLPLAKARLC